MHIGTSKHLWGIARRLAESEVAYITGIFYGTPNATLPDFLIQWISHKSSKILFCPNKETVLIPATFRYRTRVIKDSHIKWFALWSTKGKLLGSFSTTMNLEAGGWTNSLIPMNAAQHQVVNAYFKEVWSSDIFSKPCAEPVNYQHLLKK